MKKFKSKRKTKKRNVILILIAFIFVILFIFISTRNLSNNYPFLVNYLLEENGFVKQRKISFFSHFTNNLDLLLDNYYFINEKDNNSIIIYNEQVEKKKVKNEPIVYLYSTHDNEKYSDNKNGVMDVNNLLKEKLDSYGINSIVEGKRVSTFLDKENLAYNKSYTISRGFLEDVILKYPELNYFIDIHRDSVDGNITTTVIDDKKYARIMFVLGLENPNYLENKDLIIKLNNYLNTNYPNLSRGIYEKQGTGVNGIYNQDFHKNTILIEVGGIDNSYIEVVNSTEIIAEAMYHIIGEKDE